MSSSGAISAAATLTPGVYVVSGTDTDVHGDIGTWSFTLSVVAVAPTISVAPTTPGAIGETYTPVVTTSGADATITSTTPTICVVRNDVVTYLASGVCTLSFALVPSASDPSPIPVLQHITVRVPAKVHLILFDFVNDRWNLTTSMRHRLNALAGTIKRDDDTHIAINGYASLTGGAAHNVMLSRRRAAIVTQVLVADLKNAGATVTVVKSTGHGATTFVSSNTAAPANRRVSVYAW